MPGRPGRARRWEWHRLDDQWAARLVAFAEIRPGDLVLDVGAGTGAITHQLVNAGARVVAVELHPGRVADLRTRFATAPVKVVRADAHDLYLPRRRFKVVANPPFGASIALVRRLTTPGSRLEGAALVVPTWLATRFVPRPGPSKGLFRYERGPRIPGRAFVPPPPTAPVVLVIRRDTPR